jgi:hypothetical protein
MKHKLSEKKNFSFSKLGKKIYHKIQTNIFFILMMVYIVFYYYIYIFVRIISIIINSLRYQGNIVTLINFSKNGFDLKFWKLQNYTDKNYRSAFIYFIIFHYLLFWMILSLMKVSLSDPGELPEDLKNGHSLLNSEEFKKLEDKR